MKKAIMFGLVLLSLFLIGCAGNEATGNSVVKGSNQYVEIPVDEITTQLTKYDYNAKGIAVTYFAVKGTDGNIRTAFDACDVCGGKKGYHQQGTDIVCNNCGRVFSINGLGTQNKGYGCWPSYLPHKIENNQVIISTKDLEAGAYRFK
ncbi:MAG: DUF2318 domain-containing protein [Candidatus Woesearchaeota archaeon]